MFQKIGFRQTDKAYPSTVSGESSTNVGFWQMWVLAPILCLFGPFLNAQVFHDTHFREIAAAALEQTYNCKFEQAATQLSQLQGTYPDHPAPHFLLATNRWWQSYISTDDHYHSYIQEELVLALEKNKALKGDPSARLEYVFFQYMSYAFLTRLYTLRREWFRAANYGRRALPHLREGLSFARQSPEFYFSAGIYHYYAATYPEAHPYVRPFMVFFPDGDEELGISELRQAATVPNFTQAEAMFYLSDIFLDQPQRRQEATQLKRQLHEQYPNNAWFQVNYARSLIIKEEYDAALEVLNPLIKRMQQIPQHLKRTVNSQETPMSSLVMQHAYYHRGLIYQRTQRPDLAFLDFQKATQIISLAKREGDPTPASAWWELGRAYDQQGERKKALQAYEEALDQEPSEHVSKRVEACVDVPCRE
ncbi:MAG: tetratricopeptide repeat protein [Bacteroidota bacterium]